METSQSARRRGRKSGYEMSQNDDWVEAPKSKSQSKEIKQKGIIDKGPRVQDDGISVTENLIEEIILQDKFQKTKYVDNNPQTSTSQIEQEQKPKSKSAKHGKNRFVCPKRKLLYGHVIYHIMPT